MIRRISLVDEYGQRRVRMAYLAIVASQKVNGVSKLHSQLMTRDIFADFARIYPERFTNVTNGITPRRWLAQASPSLSSLIDQQMRQLSSMIPADDARLRASLVGSVVFGVVIGRHLLEIDTLRDASPDAIIALLRPGFQSLITGKDPA